MVGHHEESIGFDAAKPIRTKSLSAYGSLFKYVADIYLVLLFPSAK